MTGTAIKHLTRNCTFLLFLVATTCQGQWQKIATIDKAVSVVKFFTPTFGLLGTGSSPGGPVPTAMNIYRTIDGGHTWTQCTIPSYGIGTGEVTDFFMRDQMHGWVTLTGGLVTGGLWSTSDGGITWQRTPYPAGGTSVNLTSKALVVTDLFGKTQISRDSGQTWSMLPDAGKNDASFSDDLRGISSSYRGGFWQTTSDGGLTWTSSTTNIEAWSVYAVKGSATAFAAPEGNSAAPSQPSPVIVSHDYGNNWQTLLTLPFTATGHIAGVKDTVLFVQQCSNASVGSILHDGFSMSTDRGLTWKVIGGPEALNDTRFCLVQDCDSTYVYAFDEPYPYSPPTVLYRYAFAFPVFSDSLPPTFSVRSIPSVSACDSSSGLVRITIGSCPQKIRLDTIALVGDTVHFALGPFAPIMLTLGGLTGDSVYVHFMPRKQAGKFSTKLHIHSTNILPDTLLSFDTVIDLSANATPVPPQLDPLSDSLDFGVINTCRDAQERTAIFVNHGCASDTITSITLNGSGFTGFANSLPIIVAPGDSVALRYRFFPPDTGTFSGLVKLHVISMGLTEDPSISLTGFGVQGLGTLSIQSTALNAGNVSFCADTTLATSILNTGCDTLVISNIRLVGDGTITLVSSASDSLLLPDSSRSFDFYYHALSKGAHSAQLSFHSQNIRNDAGHDTTVFLSGLSIDGTRYISTSLHSATFRPMYLCETRDTTLWLRNPGCDTLTVISDTIDNVAYSSYAQDPYPIRIPPGDSTLVHVHLTADSNGMAGTLTFTSDADTGGTISVPLMASFLRPVHLSIMLAPTDSAKSQESVTVLVIVTVPGYVGEQLDAISAIRFDLRHDDDLLSFDSLSSDLGLNISSDPPLHGIMTQHVTFIPQHPLSIGAQGDTIGRLAFTVFLSRDSVTPLAVSNLSFDNTFGLSPDCIASLGDSGTTFNYIYVCGERTIQQFMRNGFIYLDNIIPNPAQDEIEVRVSNFTNGISALDFKVFDLLGRERMSGECPLLKLQGNSFFLHVAGLPEGSYYLRLSGAGIVVSRKMVIQR